MSSRGGIPNDDLKNFLIDRMELDADRNWSLPELIQRYTNSGLWINPADEAGTIVTAQSMTNTVTANLAVNPAWSAIPGLQIWVPPTDRDVWLKWRTTIGITTAGQGTIQTAVFDITNGANTVKDVAVHHVIGTDVVASTQDTLRGDFHVGAIPSDGKLYQLYGNVAREAASGLNANVFMGNGPYMAYLTAVAL